MGLKILVARFNSEVQKGMKTIMISRLLKMPIVVVSTESNTLFATENYSVND